jgi:S-adenosylmethionine:tRNA ribosyltransferase-isomerase
LDLDLYDYELPASAIAQEPTEKRDASRLMVIDRRQGSIVDCYFSDLPAFLEPGDVLVFNDSRVIPARLMGQKRSTGARIELLLANPLVGYDINSPVWQALAKPGRRLKPGDMIDFSDSFSAEVMTKSDDGGIEVFLHTVNVYEAIMDYGSVPLPPYIRRPAETSDIERYQTVYASEPGSVAAPTAGLHFTPELILRCLKRGVETAWVTLHVGIGTFQAVTALQIDQHQMHPEWCGISEDTALLLNNARRDGRRVIAVGTTAVRTLESAVTTYDQVIDAGWKNTDIFIYPGYEFKAVDGMVTNFHLPKSTLLMLVSAFDNRDRILTAYRHALEAGYRFYSYGDAMLIV